MKKISIVLSFLLLLAAFSSCKTSKKAGADCLPDNSKVSTEDKMPVIDAIKTNRFNFDYLAASASCSYKSSGSDYNFNLNIRMERDKRIWMSATALFLEAARILIDKDSIYIINYLQGTATVRSLDFVGQYVGQKVTVGQIQDILTGNSVFDHSRNTDFEKTDVIKLKDRINQFLFTTVLTKENFRPASIEGTEPGPRKINLYYGDYQQLKCRLLPQKVKINAVTDKDNIVVNLEYSDISLENITEWPFKIPAKYERQ